jgi:hypothetical protein
MFVAVAAILFSWACAVGAIWYFFRSMRELFELQSKPEPPAPQPPQAFPHRQDLVQVLHHTHDGWKHHSWAQDGTHACKHAIETPGMAVKRGEDVDYGVQS